MGSLAGEIFGACWAVVSGFECMCGRAPGFDRALCTGGLLLELGGSWRWLGEVFGFLVCLRSCSSTDAI